ncbi:four helix bundle protein [Tenacibaculum sp. SDUM215027]|uniref:four helix bundle protein n=1 Tax=Tenacibaculum sp. SDUM215027 TaxID=3422596 RepID=UPI003D31CDE9
MRNFRNLDIWKQGIEIVKLIYNLSERLPSEEKFGLRSQITRAAVSIPSNIAEGASRNSEVEFKRFLEISIGSLFEIETQLVIIEELGFISSKELKPIFELLEKETKMINSLINKIKTKSKSQELTANS